jgi:hypothetical protein
LPTDDPQVRPFAAVLQDLARGQVHTDLSTQLAELTAAVAETGRKGTITLTITVDLAGKGAEALTVAARVDAKPPRRPAPPTVFFADDAGNLTRYDPNQPTLPLRGLQLADGNETRKEATA